MAYIKKLSDRHSEEGTRLSLRSIAAALRKAKIGLIRGESENTFLFRVYKIIGREKIWFGVPGKNPKWGAKTEKKDKVAA